MQAILWWTRPNLRCGFFLVSRRNYGTIADVRDLLALRRAFLHSDATQYQEQPALYLKKGYGTLHSLSCGTTLVARLIADEVSFSGKL